jgi:hypothetical protein
LASGKEFLLSASKAAHISSLTGWGYPSAKGQRRGKKLLSSDGSPAGIALIFVTFR